MGWRAGRTIVAGALATAALLGSLVTAAPSAHASRGQIVALPGGTPTLDTPLTTVSAMAVDNVNRRLYLASRPDNTIIETDFDGVPIAVRTTFAQPSALAIGGGNVYALLSGTGQVVRLDPATLEPTLVTGGLVEAGGLAYSGGSLYTTVGQIFTATVTAINPANGNVSNAGLPSTNAAGMLWTFPQRPGSLYMTRFALSPGGIFRHDLGASTTTYRHESPEQIEMLPDGDIVTLSGISDEPGGLLARDGITLELSGRRWPVPSGSPAYAMGWAAADRALAIAGGDTIEVRSLTETATLYRSFRLLQGYQVFARSIAMSSDSSRIFVAAKTSTVRLFVLPGVTDDPGAVAAPGTPSARRVAPGAAGVAAATRAVPPATTFPGYVFASIGDIEFDANGNTFVSDPINGIVDVFDRSNRAIAGWRDLGGVSSLALLGTTMYGVLTGEGSIVRLDPNRRVAERIARNIVLPQGLLAANGRLWTTRYRGSYDSVLMSLDPATGQRSSDSPLTDRALNWSDPSLAERPAGTTIFAANTFGASAFDVSTLTWTNFSSGPIGPVAVPPDGAYVVDGQGRRTVAGTFAFDGFVYPGTRHTLSGLVSGTRLVAAILQSGTLMVYDETNPGHLVDALAPAAGVTINRIEFRPGTLDLWIAFTDAAGAHLAIRTIDPLQTVALGDAARPDDTIAAPVTATAPTPTAPMQATPTSAVDAPLHAAPPTPTPGRGAVPAAAPQR